MTTNKVYLATLFPNNAVKLGTILIILLERGLHEY